MFHINDSNTKKCEASLPDRKQFHQSDRFTWLTGFSPVAGHPRSDRILLKPMVKLNNLSSRMAFNYVIWCVCCWPTYVYWWEYSYPGRNALLNFQEYKAQHNWTFTVGSWKSVDYNEILGLILYMRSDMIRQSISIFSYWSNCQKV